MGSKDIITSDLVVVGGGAGGLAAAVAAAEKGIKVTVLEKYHAPGGNALFAVSLFAAESQLQKNAGIQALRDTFFKRAMEWSHWRADGRLIRTLIDKSGETIDWLQEKGVKFERITLPESNQKSPQMLFPPTADYPFPFWAGGVKRGARSIGDAVIKVLIENCRQLDVKILCDTRAKQILTDKAGQVIGVLAQSQENDISINSKTVIISTGGFLGNKELMKKYFHSYTDDLYDDIYLWGLPHMGDGLLMAQEIGANTDGTVAFEWEGNKFPWLPVGSSVFHLTENHNCIWVNKKGERFVDESEGSALNSLYRQLHKTFYVVFDEKIKQALYSEASNRSINRITPIEADKELQLQVEKGRVKIDNSLEEIAKWIGADSKVLRSTIDEYNSFCNKGHDDIFLKNPANLIALNDQPYYAIKCCLNMILTRGPLKVSCYMEVINKEDNPIPGLYAAGVDIGGTDSDTYCGTLSGHSLSFALNSGRIAAESAVKYISS